MMHCVKGKGGRRVWGDRIQKRGAVGGGRREVLMVKYVEIKMVKIVNIFTLFNRFL